MCAWQWQKNKNKKSPWRSMCQMFMGVLMFKFLCFCSLMWLFPAAVRRPGAERKIYAEGSSGVHQTHQSYCQWHWWSAPTVDAGNLYTAEWSNPSTWTGGDLWVLIVQGERAIKDQYWNWWDLCFNVPALRCISLIVLRRLFTNGRITAPIYLI